MKETVDLLFKRNDVAPSLQSRYSIFITTARHSVPTPHWYSDSHCCEIVRWTMHNGSPIRATLTFVSLRNDDL